MKIALLHYAAHPIVGGVEKVIFEHSRLMAEAGHEVCVIAGRGAQTDPGIAFVSLPRVDSQAPEVLELKRELDAGRVPVAFEAFSRALEMDLLKLLTGQDLVIAHNVCSLNMNLALTAALRRIFARAGIGRLVLWHHDLAWTTPRYAAELHPGYPWDLLRGEWPGAIHVTVSRFRAKELARLLGFPESLVHVVPNGLGIGEFLKLGVEATDIARTHALQEADPLLILPVRATPRKNIEKSLEVLTKLRAHFPNALLIITGPVGAHNESNRAYLDNLIHMRARLGVAESAIFLARETGNDLADEVINDLYRLADALLLPSREEGFGIPLIEAGARGIPVFCSDIGPLREIGGADVTYFDPDEDADSIATKISNTLKASRTHALRKRVMRDFSWATIYNRHLAPIIGGR